MTRYGRVFLKTVVIRCTSCCAEPEKVPVASGVLGRSQLRLELLLGWLTRTLSVCWESHPLVRYNSRCINAASDCRRAALSCGTTGVTKRVVGSERVTVAVGNGTTGAASARTLRAVLRTGRNDNSPKTCHLSANVKSTKTMIEKS